MRIFAFSLAFLLSLSVSAAVLVTETVGQVSDYVVTSREVQISLAISGNTEVRPGRPGFANAVTQVLLEQVVALEAENFNVSSVSEEELAAALARLEKTVAGKSSWAQLEPSPEEVKRFSMRKLVAASFLKFKTSSMTSIITDQEAQAYYEKNRAKFGSAPFAEFRESIKTFLAQQQLEDRLRSWFEVIKRKYKVRNFVVE